MKRITGAKEDNGSRWRASFCLIRPCYQLPLTVFSSKRGRQNVPLGHLFLYNWVASPCFQGQASEIAEQQEKDCLWYLWKGRPASDPFTKGSGHISTEAQWNSPILSNCYNFNHQLTGICSMPLYLVRPFICLEQLTIEGCFVLYRI